MKAPAKNLESASAFTLLELLVAMAVMALVMVALVSITNGTASLTQGAQGRIGGNAEFRTTLDRLSADLDIALIRSDLRIIADKDEEDKEDESFITIIKTFDGNDLMEFYIASPGYAGDRPISRIRYEISSNDGSSVLLRTPQSFGWTQEKVRFSTNSTISDPDTDNDSIDKNNILGSKIFRLDCQFLLNNGTYTSNPKEFQNARALVVSLAAIDDQAIAKMRFPASELANLLPDPSNSPAYEVWSNLLASPDFVSNNPSIPPAVLSGIQTAGRIIPLPRQR